MTGWIVRMIGDAIRSASTHRHPSAIALAFAFGLAIGLIPKDNLFALGLVAAMCFFRMNYLLTATLIVVVSMGSPWFDGLSDQVGQWLLERPSLQAFWNEIATWPVLAWFRWNNSVVLGGFSLGILSSVPVYAACMSLTHRIFRYQNQSRVDAIVSEINHYHVQVQSEQRKRQKPESEHLIEDRHRTIKKRSSEQHRIDTKPSHEVFKPNIVEARPEPAKAMQLSEAFSKKSSAVLRETVIEIVRYRPKDPSSTPAFIEQPFIEREPGIMSNLTNPMTTHSATQEIPKPRPKAALLPPHVNVNANESLPLTPNQDSKVNEVQAEKPREEALRYLLWHLSGVQRQSRNQEPVS